MSTTTTTGLPPRHDPNAVSQQQQRTSSMSNNLQQPPIPPSLPPARLTASQSFIRIVHPRDDLLVGSREDYIDICVPLYEASINGDWEAANRILQRRELVRFSITENCETALHIAASAQSIEFVDELVKLMDKEDLELKNKSGNTAFCLAAAAGNTKMLEIMVNANRGLLTTPGSLGMMPLYMAALLGYHETVKYLYDNSHKMKDDFWTSQNRGWVLLKCIEADLFDIALNILEDCPELAQTTEGVLGVLARKPYAFNDIKPHFFWKIINGILAVIQVRVPGTSVKESEAMKLLKIIWKNIMKMPKVEIDNLLRGPYDKIMKDGKLVLNMKDGKRTYSSRILFVAAEMGNAKFVVELIRQYPDLIWKLNDNNQSIFHIAVAHRHESIYNLLYEIGSMKDMITPLKDPAGNNMLHLVGRIAKNRVQDVSGVTFQMQRELLWFKVNLTLFRSL